MRWATSIALALLLGASAPASAATLFEDDELTLSVGSLVRLGYIVEASGDDATQRPYFQMARVAAGVQQDGLGRAFVQVEGASETVRLLDAFVELKPDDVFAARIGVFRLPTTADFYVGAANILFSNRSMLVTMTQPRLAGAEVESTIASETLALNARVGFFQPTSATRELLPDGEGNFASFRVGLDLAMGLGVHVAYLQLVLADNDPVAPNPDDPEIRPVAHPQVIDAAITFRRGGWDASVEGLVAPSEDGDTDFAGYAQAGYRVDVSDTVGIMPAARFGVQEVSAVTRLKTTVGTSIFFGEHLKLLPNYELLLTDGDDAHAGILTLQGVF